jgi:hypothetical protein
VGDHLAWVFVCFYNAHDLEFLENVITEYLHDIIRVLST